MARKEKHRVPAIPQPDLQLDQVRASVQERNREIVEKAMAAYRDRQGAPLCAQHELALNVLFLKNKKVQERAEHLAQRPANLILPTELVLVRVNPRFPQNPCFIERGMDRRTGRRVARKPARDLRGKREGGPGVGTGKTRYLCPGVETMNQLRIWSAAWVEAQAQAMPENCRFGPRDERVRQGGYDKDKRYVSPAKQWWANIQAAAQAAQAEGAA